MWFPVRSYGLEKKRMKNELKSTQTAYAHINCTSCPTPAERTLTAAQRARADPLDIDLARLRARKAILEPDTYYAELEQILRQLTPIYHLATTPSHGPSSHQRSLQQRNRSGRQRSRQPGHRLAQKKLSRRMGYARIWREARRRFLMRWPLPCARNSERRRRDGA